MSRLLLAAPADTMSGNVLQVAANIFEIMIVFFSSFFQATNAFLSLSIVMERGTARTTATRLRLRANVDDNIMRAVCD